MGTTYMIALNLICDIVRSLGPVGWGSNFKNIIFELIIQAFQVKCKYFFSLVVLLFYIWKCVEWMNSGKHHVHLLWVTIYIYIYKWLISYAIILTKGDVLILISCVHNDVWHRSGDVFTCTWKGLIVSTEVNSGSGGRLNIPEQWYGE